MMTETVVTVQEVPPNNNATKQTHSPDQPLSWVKINLEYFKTVPGLIKIIEFVLGILCMALASPVVLSVTHWFLFVVVTSFIGTIIWIFVYFLGVREALNLPIHWILTELLNTAICALGYVIVFIAQLAVYSGAIGTHHRGSNIAAGVFGLFNTLAYGFGTYLLYLEWKNTRR